MPIKAHFGSGRVVIATVITLAILPALLLAEEPRYKLVQVVRYVLETAQFAQYASYRYKIETDRLTYDIKYRDPFDPPGPAQVDCANVGRVGVTFYVTRPSGISRENVSTRTLWSHSNVKLDDSRLRNYRTHYFLKGHKAVLASQGVRLWDELRADGILSVRVLIDGKEVLENSFNLVGCPIASD